MINNTQAIWFNRSKALEYASFFGKALALSLVMGILSQIKVPLWGSPVPFTLQTLGLFLIAAFTGPRLAATTLFFYLAQGAMGVPVFAGQSFGFMTLFGPTGGYLIGFFFSVVSMSWLLQNKKMKAHLASLFGVFLLGQVIVYGFGLLWLSRFIPFQTSVTVGVLPFVYGGLVKNLLAVAIVHTLVKYKHVFRPKGME